MPEADSVKPSKKRVKDDDEEEQFSDEGHEEEDKQVLGDEKKKRRKRKRKRSKASKSSEADVDGVEKVETEKAGEGADETARTIFVEGVPYDSTPEQVAECLQTHANIERDTIVDLRFPQWQDSGRMRGYGHVVFSSIDALNKVLDVANSGQKMYVGRRYLNIQQARPRGLGPANAMTAQHHSRNKEPSKTIMIKNLDYNATEEDIESVMNQFGTIVEGGVRIARNFQTRQNKGFAYVDYEDLASAKKAMKRQDSQPDGPIYILKRACIFDYDEGRIKGSFKTSDGRLWSKEYKETSKMKARS